MSSSLQELCNLVADVGIGKATKVSAQLEGFLIHVDEPQVTLDGKARQTIFLGFVFTAWTFANGVWSNLKTTKFRRDLLDTSMQSFALKAAVQLSGSQDPH